MKGQEPVRVKTRLHLEPMFPEAGADFDTPPADVAANPDAVEEWRRLLPIMREAGALTEAERPVLAAACLQWAIYLEAYRKMRADGMVSRKGRPTAHTVIANQAVRVCQQLWNELGITPRSRSKIQPALQQAKEAVDKWAV